MDSTDNNLHYGQRSNKEYDGNGGYRYNKQRYYNQIPRADYSYRNKQPWSRCNRDKKHLKKKYKKTSRPSSPVVGSEEYISQKIQKTSAIIMRHLLSPEENIIPIRNDSNDFIPLEGNTRNNSDLKNKNCESGNERKRTNSIGGNDSTNKKACLYRVEEINNKLMSYLSNLNDGRRKNFISTNTSVYDDAINQIIKQKRLEISRALRNVCMQTADVTESSELINSIIPDMGIKIEELPKEVLEALQNTFSIYENVDIGLVDAPTMPVDEPMGKEGQGEVVEIVANDIIDLQCMKEETDDVQIIEDNIITIDVHHEETVHNENVPRVILEQDIVQDQLILESGNCLKNKPSKSTQTRKMTIEEFIQRNYGKPPKTFATAMKRMFQIDKQITTLTAYRQSLFKGLKIKKKIRPTTPVEVIVIKDKKRSPSVNINKITNRTKHKPVLVSKENESKYDEKLLQFGNIPEKVLVLKICQDKLLAGTESGKIYFFSLQDGHCTQVLKVATVSICCMHYAKEDKGKPYLFVGHCGSSLKIYNFYSGCLIENIKFDDSIHCIDEKWGYLFFGCKNGTILRYSMKKNNLEYEERFDRHPIFVIRATQEGARMVLLIGSRNSSVIIRDAMSGLHLRTMDSIMAPTVYSMIMEKHFVYCGTTTHDILVFSFHSGKLMHTYKATNAKGIGCMKIVGKCLFASCHNGKVYAFNLETNSLVGTMDGPGGVIISMEVLKNQVMVGTMSFKFTSIPIPRHILGHM